VSWAVAGTSSPRVHAPRARDGTGQEFRRKRPATIELPDHTGRPRNLSELPAGDRMIVVLAREAYSAKDQLQHERLGQPWREMTPGVGDCRMVTIATTTPRRCSNWRHSFRRVGVRRRRGRWRWQGAGRSSRQRYETGSSGRLRTDVYWVLVDSAFRKAPAAGE
jgi:hypothetical protein